MRKLKGFSRFPIYIILVCISGFFFNSCGLLAPTRPIQITIHNPASLPSQSNETLLAGAAQKGITPPPGMPMAGHSISSCKGKGVRNKLMARAIYLKPKNGKPVALVQVDMLSGSLVVHHKVAELIAPKTDIEAAGLLIAATHTHSAPGNFFDSHFYNKVDSNISGFEEQYFHFLSTQIADAVIEAYQNRKPARIATGSTKIKADVTRNRSIKAYKKNKLPPNEDPNQFSAVNRCFHMIRVDCLDETDGNYKPLAVFSNYSIHSNTNPKILEGLYSADVAGYIERILQDQIKRQYSPPWSPIHAAANFTHADNNPYYGKKGKENFTDFERVGRIIADAAFTCFRQLDHRLTDHVTIKYRTQELNLFEDRAIKDVKIAKRPKAGIAMLGGGGGKGRQSFLANIPFLGAPGWPRWIFTKGSQGAKRQLFFSLFQYLVLPKKSFPRHAFLQVIRVNDAVLLALPWEVTYHLGKQIAQQARQSREEAGLEGENKINNYIVVSCSNGYFGYVTTAAEYKRQNYEGGSNLYGPNTGRFLQLHMGHMVAAMATGSPPMEALAPKWEFNLRARNFYPKKQIPLGKRKIIKDARFHSRYETVTYPHWSFKWRDVPPCLIQWHKPLVSIQESTDKKKWFPHMNDGIPVDDSGSDISIHYLKKISRKQKPKQNMGIYEARWYHPTQTPGKYYRFVIKSRGSLQEFYSRPFEPFQR